MLQNKVKLRVPFQRQEEENLQGFRQAHYVGVPIGIIFTRDQLAFPVLQ